jgi:aminopeptidase N
MTSALLLVATTLLASSAAAAAQRDTLHTYRPGIDVLDYELTIDLPERGHAIDGRAVLSVRRTAGVDSLILDLIGLRVDSVLVNARATSFGRDSATLRIPLASVAGDSFAVAVRYRGDVSDGLIVGTDSLGRWTGFGDNFASRARYWIPSVDHPSDKATVTWVVRAPSDRTVVANGKLIEETPLPASSGTPERTLTRWRESRPVPVYVMVIAAAPLAAFDLGSDQCGVGEFDRCVPQTVYVAPEVRSDLPGPFGRANDIVRFFSTLIAPYPYEKLAHLQSSTRFGGMENSSAIFYSDRAFRTHTMNEGLIAHETAHQWFGDAVTEREWQHIWLSEGFATYFAALYAEHAHGDSAMRATMAQIRRTVLQAPVVKTNPVIDSTKRDGLDLLNANSYQKGGFTLHMLRDLVGDSAFFRGVRSYFLAHRHGNAMTSDLQRAVEQASGQQLGWFFDQWLRRPGWADVTAAWRWDAAQQRVLLDVEQGATFGAFRFPLTVAITDARGAVHRLRVDVPAQGRVTRELPLTLDAAPTRLELDPDVHLLATFTVR